MWPDLAMIFFVRLEITFINNLIHRYYYEILNEGAAALIKEKDIRVWNKCVNHGFKGDGCTKILKTCVSYTVTTTITQQHLVKDI